MLNSCRNRALKYLSPEQLHADLDHTLSAGGGRVSQHQAGAMGIPGKEHREKSLFGNKKALIRSGFQERDIVLRAGLTDGLAAGVGRYADLFAALGPVEKVGVFLMDFRVGALEGMGGHVHDVDKNVVSVDVVAAEGECHDIGAFEICKDLLHSRGIYRIPLPAIQLGKNHENSLLCMLMMQAILSPLPVYLIVIIRELSSKLNVDIIDKMEFFGRVRTLEANRKQIDFSRILA